MGGVHFEERGERGGLRRKIYRWGGLVDWFLRIGKC